jgi:uncharacterized protein YndB with AHSA1/START domain
MFDRGAIRVDMRGPDGTIYFTGGYYQEIVEPEKLVFSSSPSTARAPAV